MREPTAPAFYDRVLTGHCDRHLDRAQRSRFLGEARRAAGELVVVGAADGPAPVRDGWSERVLGAGSIWGVCKRYLDPHALLVELGDGSGEIRYAARWFAVVRSSG